MDSCGKSDKAVTPDISILHNFLSVYLLTAQ